MQLSSTRATPQWERPRSLIVAFVHEGSTGTSSLDACRSRPRERRHDVSVHTPCSLLVVFCRRGRCGPAIAGTRALLVHVTRLRTQLASLVVQVTTGQMRPQEGESRIVERRQRPEGSLRAASEGPSRKIAIQSV